MLRFGIYVLLFCVFFSAKLGAQTYRDSILQYRQHYKEEFITDKRSPLKASDTGYLDFYKPDITYSVSAILTRTANAATFMIPTHSGKKKPYREYGTLAFKLHGEKYLLHAYQSADSTKKELARYLFIPFTDETNSRETFGGGRYIDMDTSEVKSKRLLLDFNKCYNPYCAYAEGYSCPIPPDENKLKTAIRAGEKLFSKQQ